MKTKQSFVLAVFLVSALLLATAPVFAQYNEAPALAELVSHGKLPPVEQRLPADPVVIEPLDEVGQYGGRIIAAEIQQGGETSFLPYVNEPLVRWNRAGNAVIPNVARSWEVSEDARTFTFHLVEGIKWSDGEPLTVDDIMFWYEDLLMNEEFTPVIPTWLATLEYVKKVDDYTVEFHFSQPYLLFLEQIAFQSGGRPLLMMIHPKHYLKQFHPNYVPADELQALVSQANYDSWVNLFQNKFDFRLNPEIPVIHGWVLQTPGTRQVMVRNPYYWKVDTAGNQLPYIDEVVIDVVLDPETIAMKIVAGEINFQFNRISLADLTLFRENESAGNYTVKLWDTTVGSSMALMPNLNHPDPYLNELFNNRDFRIALSYAIDREEINDFGYLGLAQPRQATVLEGSAYFEEDLPGLYADYDVKKANEILDSLGLDKRNRDGYRLRPDGEVLEFRILCTDSSNYGPWVDIVDLVTGYWNDIGLKVDFDVVSGTLYTQRRGSGDFDVMIWAWGRGLHPLIEPTFMFPYLRTTGAPEYSTWYTTRGEAGIEPPAEMKEIMALYDEYLVATDFDARHEIGKKIVRMSAENIWSIGTVGVAPTPIIVHNKLRNVPERDVVEFILQHIAHTDTVQYYFAQ